MRNLLLVGLGGFVGAIARYAVGIGIGRIWTANFPLATLLVNVAGCFVLGYFATLATERYSLDPAWRLLVATGLVGAFTTFSAFEFETDQLAKAGMAWWAVLNVVASVVFGFMALRLGEMLAR